MFRGFPTFKGTAENKTKYPSNRRKGNVISWRRLVKHIFMRRRDNILFDH